MISEDEARKKKEKLMKARAEANTLNKMNNMIKRNHTKEAIFEVNKYLNLLLGVAISIIHIMIRVILCHSRDQNDTLEEYTT